SENSKSTPPERTFSASFSSSVMVISGCMAAFSPRSARIERVESFSTSLTTSAMKDLPYILRRCWTGTLPGRKPFSRTLSLASVSLAISLLSMSPAGTTTLISRLRPVLSVSVTCIIRPSVQIAGRRRPAARPAEKILPEVSLVRVEGLEPPSFWHLDLNQACLPVPPHPLKGAGRPRKRVLLYHSRHGVQTYFAGKAGFLGRWRHAPHSHGGCKPADEITSFTETRTAQADGFTFR